MASKQPPDDVFSDGFSSSVMESPSHASAVTFGFMDIPEEVDDSGKVVEWSTAPLTRIEPFIDPDDARHPGGSGILDTDPATHLYIRVAELGEAQEQDPELVEQRRMYMTENIDNLVDSDVDDESRDESSDGENDDSDSVDHASSHSSPLESPVNSFATITQFSVTGFAAIKSSPEKLSLITSGSELDSPANTDSEIVSPASSCTSDRPSEDTFNLEELWADLEILVTGIVLPEDHDSPCEYFPTSLSSLGPIEPESELLDDIPEPPAHSKTPLEIIVAFGESSIARFQPVKKKPMILLQNAGAQTLRYPYTEDHVAIVCYNIMLTNRIKSVTCTTTPDFAIDLEWVHRNANSIFSKSLPGVRFYQDIQDLSLGSSNHSDAATVNFIYNAPPYLMSALAKHGLLRFPLMPPPHFHLSQTHHSSQSTQEDVGSPANASVCTAERNLSISQLVKRIYLDSKRAEVARRKRWEQRFGEDVPYSPPPGVTFMPEEAAMVDDWQRDEHVECTADWDHYGARSANHFDLQGIDWERKVGLRRSEVHRLRARSYHAWDNIGGKETERKELPPRTRLPETLNAVNFVPKAMHSAHRPRFTHYQLRNMLTFRDQLQLVYADGPAGKVYTTLPYNSTRTCVVDLSTTSNKTPYADPVRITTLALSTDERRSVVVVGGLEGEMAIRNLDAMFQDEDEDGNQEKDKGVMFEWVTNSDVPGECVVNHIDVDVYAHRGQVRAVLACNDRKIRTYDVQSQTWLHGDGKKGGIREGGTNTGWQYPWPVNCTAACPDGKLRVIVGDTPDVAIISTDTGRCERLLKGHADYGFACAWSPDALQVATANQDGVVHVYDTRTWRVIRSWAAYMAGHRSLKFSPVGGGPRALLCAEPADRVTVVNAVHYEDANTHSFFGEIAGIDWCGDGGGFWVGNADEVVGGFMEYERRGFGQVAGLGWKEKDEEAHLLGDWVQEGGEEWVGEEARWSDSRCGDPGRTGRIGGGGFAAGGFEGWAEN